jgi:hypothetical protein
MASANSVAPASPAESGGSQDVSSGIRSAPVSPAKPGASGNISGGAVTGTPSAADKAVLMAKKARVASPQYTPAPEQERAAASARKAATPEAVAPHPADPKVWLQQIAALRAAGKAEQADAEMRHFKAVFPNYDASAAQPDLRE